MTAAQRAVNVTRPRVWSLGASLRAVVRSAIFVLKMTPLRPNPIDRLTARPVIETFTYATGADRGQAQLYRPRSAGPHPAVVVALGVIPVDYTHPMVTSLGEGLARSGFAALLHWSPTMRDLRLDPRPIAEITTAYDALVAQPYADATRSGLMGVCVGASYALIAAADPKIRDRVRFVFAYAPYSSIWTLAVDIASASRTLGDTREPWDVDPLTWKTYVRSVTDWLVPEEAGRLREAFEDRIAWNATKTVIVHSAPRVPLDPSELSDDARSVVRLLRAGADDVEAALRELPTRAKALLTAMSPLTYVNDITAPRIMLLHDRYDHVIPVGESRRLWDVLSGRPGASYVEMGLRHLRMPNGLSPLRLAREIGKTYLAWYPLFRETAAGARRP